MISSITEENSPNAAVGKSGWTDFQQSAAEMQDVIRDQDFELGASRNKKKTFQRTGGITSQKQPVRMSMQTLQKPHHLLTSNPLTPSHFGNFAKLENQQRNTPRRLKQMNKTTNNLKGLLSQSLDRTSAEKASKPGRDSEVTFSRGFPFSVQRGDEPQKAGSRRNQSSLGTTGF